MSELCASSSALISHSYFDGISLPFLEEVAEFMYITTDRYDALGEPVVGGSQAPVDIFLPTLREVEELNIDAPIKSFMMPTLEKIGSGGMTIHAHAADLPAVDIELPLLSSLRGDIDLQGRLGRIDLGKVKETDYKITIEADTPAEINSALYKVRDMSITGAIKALNFDSIAFA
ncbi:hypothetical protein BJX70DRAFT_338900 [Aspergillus crustosus]